jgi:hypothetical protein
MIEFDGKVHFTLLITFVILVCQNQNSYKISSMMNFRKNRLIHWIASLAIAMSALAPAISQAVSLSQHGQGLTMEICSASGSKAGINIQIDDPVVADQAQPCPYCLAQNSTIPAFNANLTFQAPQTLALLPQFFYQSPQRIAVWVTPLSTAPPIQA